MNEIAIQKPLPQALAQHLHYGEALVWWNAKQKIALKPLLWVFLLSAVILFGISLLVPEFWTQPFTDLWQPLAVWFSPTAFVALREELSRRAIMVTDGAIIDVPRWGSSRRLAWQSVRRIHRDLLTGGIQLKGQGPPIRIPMVMANEVRHVLMQQLIKVKSTNMRVSIDDSLGWLR